MKTWICFLLTIAMAIGLCACGAEQATPTQGSTAPSQTDPAPSAPTVAVDPVGIYGITGISTESPDAYIEADYGQLSIYDDGTGDIYFDDYYHDFSWEMEGDRFLVTTTCACSVPMKGTLRGDTMELVYEENVYLRFQRKTQQQLDQERIDNLRNCMVDTPQTLAVAYLGCYSGEEDLRAWLETTCPLMVSEYSFLTGIPQERIIGQAGEVYCLVPGDAQYQVSIDLLREDSAEVAKVLYRSDSGEPILLLCNDGAFYPDTQVTVVDNMGNVLSFYPYCNSKGGVEIPVNDDSEELVMDFSDYFEVYPDYYQAMLAMDWSLTDEEHLISTCWSYYENTEQMRCWTLNLSGDGTALLDLTVEDEAEAAQQYEGTWWLNYSDNDGFTWLYLNMLDANGEALESECIVLQCDYDTGILLGIREGEGTMIVPCEEEASFWWGAVG